MLASEEILPGCRGLGHLERGSYEPSARPTELRENQLDGELVDMVEDLHGIAPGLDEHQRLVGEFSVEERRLEADLSLARRDHGEYEEAPAALGGDRSCATDIHHHLLRLHAGGFDRGAGVDDLQVVDHRQLPSQQVDDPLVKDWVGPPSDGSRKDR